MSLKLPYGLSTFKEIIHEGYAYIDRTSFIQTLESTGEKYVYFLRPRRFGKSLWLSTLHNYYGLEHKSDFHKTFQKLYIGQHTTSLANNYLVLALDFSQIDTQTNHSTFSGFLRNVKQGVLIFLQTYKDFFPEEQQEQVAKIEDPTSIISHLITITHKYAPNRKIYLLIDEYDHFANEILAVRSTQFQKIVSQNGWVRKFYEAIKVGAAKSIIDRIFITGVSPITLDSMTSGFNIASNLTNSYTYHSLMGFTEQEVRQILKDINVSEDSFQETLHDMRKWYNGYKFNEEAENKLYNPNMVLYFAKTYIQRKKYPKQLLDPNITTDTSKLRSLFQNRNQNYRLHLQEILNHKRKPIYSYLTEMFSLEQDFSRQDFISLLYYMGMLTIVDEQLGAKQFAPPNYVIEKLYHQYFFQKLLQEAQIPASKFKLHQTFRQIALQNDIPQLAKTMQELLALLVNRDSIRFDEKHVKITLLSLLLHTEIYTVHSEYPLGKQHADIVLIRKPQYPQIHQFIFELKYVKKTQAHKLPQITKQATEQLQTYTKHPTIKTLTNLKAWVIILTGLDDITLKEIPVV